MRKRLTIFMALAIVAGQAAAHHSSAAHYLLNEIIEIEGVVTEFRFVSPHMRLFLNVESADGEVETWAAEGTTTVLVRRQGWTKETFVPGERVKVRGHPSRSGKPMIEWTSITKAEGTEYGGGNGSSVAVDQAESRRQR